MLKLMIQSEMEDEQKYRRNHLANDCCISSTSYPHFRYRSKTVDNDRIQNDIDICTGNTSVRAFNADSLPVFILPTNALSTML